MTYSGTNFARDDLIEVKSEMVKELAHITIKGNDKIVTIEQSEHGMSSGTDEQPGELTESILDTPVRKTLFVLADRRSAGVTGCYLPRWISLTRLIRPR